ncbi:MAG TPA: NAD-dependent epimerase/dehydratase family protein [Thermoanaerobaculia bacterium]|jgi:GDP-4-dehydro-6-deoxy-D-mannose reductase|nr:NAD-dependent epimerase/dehydratase family protein [Thermoanaerobaculia bacterium]
MHVLITGVGGFVGSRLARHLLARGDRVSGTYVDARPDLEGAELFEADLLDRAALERAVRTASPDAIVNLAGLSHIGESWDWQRMSDYFWVNIAGTENVLVAADGRPVVIASSADVYGQVAESEQPILESRRVAPQTPYALTKAAAERIALAHQAVIVRSFNLIGPGQAPKFALASWATQLAAIRRGERPPVLEVGDLSTARDFVHVDDGAEAYRLLAEKGDRGGIYNLASGHAVPMRDALNRLLAISGVHAEVQEGVYPPRPFDIPYLSGDAGRLRALGWEPRRTLDDALADIWRDFGF